MDSTTIIIAVIGVLGPIVGALITVFFMRKKTKAEENLLNAQAEQAKAEALSTEASANEQIRKTVLEMQQPLRARVQELECELLHVKAESESYRRWAEDLVCQVKELGGVPVAYTPPDKQKTQPSTRE